MEMVGGTRRRSGTHLHAAHEYINVQRHTWCNIGQKVPPRFPFPLGSETTELDCRTQMRLGDTGGKMHSETLALSTRSVV